MGLKTAGEKKCFKGGLFGATVYVALHSGDPEAGNELAGGGYARVAVASNGWTIDQASGRASNAGAVAYPDPTAEWDDPTHAGLWDAAAGGSLLASAALSHDVPAPAPGAGVSFAAGDLTFDIATDD